MRPSPRLLAGLLLLAGPLDAQRRPRADRPYVAPTEETVFTNTEESAGTLPGHTIFVNNRSSVPIVVYTAMLRECENVKQSCTPLRLNIKVRPEGRAVILRVNPKSPLEGMRYTFSYGWRADSSSIAALQALAATGSDEAQARLDANAAATAAARRTAGASDLWLDDATLTTLGAKVARVRAEPDSMVIREGRAFLLRNIVLLALDSAGAPLGRVNQGVRWSYPATAVIMTRADTVFGAIPGRVELQFRLERPDRVFEWAFPVIVTPDSGVALSARTASGRSRRPAGR